MRLICIPWSFRREDYAEQPLAGEVRRGGTGIKEQLIGFAVVTATAERQVPQARFYYCVVVRIGERAEKSSGVRIKGVDFAILDIHNEQHIAEPAEMGRRAG